MTDLQHQPTVRADSLSGKPDACPHDGLMTDGNPLDRLQRTLEALSPDDLRRWCREASLPSCAPPEK